MLPKRIVLLRAREYRAASRIVISARGTVPPDAAAAVSRERRAARIVMNPAMGRGTSPEGIGRYGLSIESTCRSAISLKACAKAVANRDEEAPQRALRK